MGASAVADTIKIDEIHYKRLDYVPGYGYLQVTLAKIEFVKVTDWYKGEGSGLKRKRRKYATRKRR